MLLDLTTVNGRLGVVGAQGQVEIPIIIVEHELERRLQTFDLKAVGQVVFG